MNNINETIIDTKEKYTLNEQVVINYLNKLQNPFKVLSVQDVSYLNQIIPNIRNEKMLMTD